MRQHRLIQRVALSGLFLLWSFPLFGQAIKMMPLGDSITLGDKSSTFEGYRKNLYTLLTNDGVSVDFVGSLTDGTGTLPDKNHEGHGGFKADQLLANLTTYLNNVASEKVVFLHIGTNDVIGNGETAAATITEIEGIIDGIKNHDSAIEIFVATLIPADTTLDSEITNLNALIVDLVSVKRTAGYKVFLVDQNQAFKQNANWATQLIFDDVHPNDAGYDLMAATWHDAFMLHSQYSTNNFVDNFNRASLGTTNWTAHANLQIANSIELGNTAGIDNWNDGVNGYIAIQKTFTDATRMSFTYGAGLTGGSTDYVGFVALFDTAATNGTGYFINRYRGNGTTSGTNSKLRLWRVIDGIIQSPNLTNTAYTQGTAQPGDEFSIEIITTPGGHTFKCYLNGVLDGTLTDAALTFNPPTRYFGTMVYGNSLGAAARIDNFTLQQGSDDAAAPDAVADLDIGIVGATTVELTWTAPGDDGASGTALSYDVRYSIAPITSDLLFDAATAASGEPSPSSAGNSESMIVGNLTPGTLYYFAIKTSDEVGNISSLSNQALATTSALIVTTDNFNRTGPDLGSNWVFDSAMQIVDVGLNPDNELDNTGTGAGEWKLAVFAARRNITNVSFQWGVNANATGIENGGPALLLDNPAITANGYMAQWRTSLNKVRVLRLLNGQPDTPVDEAAYTGNDPQAGDHVEVKMNTDGTGLHFEFYVNGVYYKRLTDIAKPNFDFNQDLYAGVILQSAQSNNIDDFTVSVAPGEPATLIKVSGDNPVQADTVGQKLPLPFVVRVEDGGGNPLSGIGVGFTITAGGGVLDSPISPDGNVHVEAESGTLTSPMGMANDPDAASGKYIVSGVGAGKAVYTINIPQAGSYRVWGRVIALDGNSDSFFFKVDNGTQIYWDVPNPSTSWTWDLVNQTSPTPVQDPKVFNLSAGNHTITIDTRDPGTKLDKLIFTTDTNFTPSGKEEIGYVTNASGEAQAYLTLGPNVGANTVQVSFGALTPVTFIATALGGNATQIVKTSGDNQSGAGGAALALPFVVTVRDVSNNPVQGHPVTFVVTQGGGSLSNSQPVLTDVSGNASTTYTLGREIATQKVEAQAAGLAGSPIVFTATATSGIATTLQIVSGNNQTANIAANLPNPVVVKVTDGTNGISNYPVEMTVTRGGGSVGASNRVKNGGFEGGESGSNPFVPTNWEFLGSPSAGEVDVVTSDKHGGANSVNLNVNASSEGIAQQYSLSANTPYTLIFWAKVSSGTLLARWYVSGPSTISMQVSAAGNGNTWKQYKISANNPSSYSNNLELSGVGSVNAFIDDVQLLQNTDGSGNLSATWTLGDTAMVQQAQATAFANNVALTGSPLALSATANAGPATTLTLVDGNNQNGSAGAPLVSPLRVKVTDSKGNPKAGHVVNWSVTAGGGKLPGNVTSLDVATNALGVSEVIPTLGPTAGAINNFRAASASLTGSPITFTATASIPNSFNITGGNNQIASASLPVQTPLTVRIADAGNLPIVNYDVLFEVIQGNGKINNLSSITIKTDVNGEAKANLVLGTVPGALNRVRASASFNSAPIAGSPVIFDVRAAKLTSIAISSGNGQTGAVGLALPQPLKAVVLDSLNNGIKSQTVTFTITGGGGKINSATAPQTVLTDSLGIAAVTFTLGNTPGTNNNTVKAEASFNSAPLSGSPLTFSASATAGAPTTLVLDSGNNQSVVVNNQLPNPLKVKATDSFGNGVQGFAVKFKIIAGGGKVNGADSVIVNTVADGTAQVNMTVGGTSGLNNNICEVTAKNGPVHLTNSPMQFLETATASSARFVDYVSGNNQNGIVGTPLTSFFVVKITDLGHVNRVQGHPVTFRIVQGGGHLDGGVDTVKTVTTDANGEAKVKLTLGPVAGATNIVRATSNDGISPLTGSPVEFNATSVAGAPSATVSTVQATTPVAANGTDLSQVTITVRDNFGNPLQGVAVAILVSGSNNFINPVLQLTTAQGVAEGSFSSTRAEVKTVTARIIAAPPNDIEITNGAQALFTPLAAAKLVNVSGNNQTGNVGTALLNPLAVKVTDTFGNPIAGHPVTFSVQSGGGLFAGTQPVLTNAQGLANGTWILGPNPGSNISNATSAGLDGSPLSFTASGVVSSAANLVQVSGNEQLNAIAGAELSAPIVVKVTDNQNRPVANHPVKFKVIFGGGKVNNADSIVVQTNFNGDASAVWKMGTLAISNFCNAIATGLAGSPVTFRAQPASGQGVKFSITGGQNSSGTVATTVGPLQVRVKDANDNGVSNVLVNFELTGGTGTLSAGQDYTDQDGYAEAFLTFGTNSGPRTVVASSNNLQLNSLTFNLTANPGPAKSMALQFGNGQTGTVNKPLNFPPSVIVKDQYNNPVGGHQISFVIASGGGNFAGQNPRNVNSGNDGIAGALWTLGVSPGVNQAQAIGQGLIGSPIVFSATGVTNNLPIIVDVQNWNNDENDHIEFMIDASDADGDPMTYGAKNLPPGAVYDSLASRLFSWTTNYNSAGVYNVSFFARDNKGGVDEEIVTIIVNNVNRAPQIVSHNPVRSDTTLASGINLLMKVTATDIDGDGLTYLWFDNGSAVSTTSTYDLQGSVNVKVPHSVEVRVSDGIDVTKFFWSVVTKIELVNFSAIPAERGGVTLNWKTASESNNAGFNVLRSRSAAGAYEKVNEGLIRHRMDGEYSFTDRSVEAGARYYYKLQDLDVNGGINEHGPVFVEVALPDAYVLHQNYPNPFNPTTNISFQLPKAGEVTLTIYNMLGQPVRTLVQGQRPAGVHAIEWDGRNDHGEQMASGVYHYRLQAGSFAETKKMLLMK